MFQLFSLLNSEPVLDTYSSGGFYGKRLFHLNLFNGYVVCFYIFYFICSCFIFAYICFYNFLFSYMNSFFLCHIVYVKYMLIKLILDDSIIRI